MTATGAVRYIFELVERGPPEDHLQGLVKFISMVLMEKILNFFFFVKINTSGIVIIGITCS